MIWKVRFKIMGGHVHCSLFCSKPPTMTFAKCGDFTVCKGDEFASLLTAFDGAQFIGEGEDDIVEAVKAA